ncbi:hypothetical protein, partial [Prolixibacter bellariivorans]|uniref:hypothetical protein n=1 Tax=Prolixibacter bellariivorans TaxID=314319 RepID=UPI0004852A2E
VIKKFKCLFAWHDWFSSKRKLNFWCLSSFLFNIFNELVSLLLIPLLTAQPSVAVGRAEKSVAKIDNLLR